MSRLDKRMTNAFYEIEIDPKTELPKTIGITILTGRRGETKFENKRIVGGRHVVFRFEYSLSGFGEAEDLEIPRAARKLLAKVR